MEPFRTSPLLTHNRAGKSRFRRPVYAVSVGLHIVAGIVLFLIHPPRPREEPEDRNPINVVFYSPIPDEVEPVVPPPPEPKRKPKIPEVKIPDPPQRKLPPEPIAPEPLLERAESHEPPKVAPPLPRRPDAPKPKVRTEVFGESPSAPAAAVPKAVARTGDFGESLTATPQRSRPTRAVKQAGGFEVPVEARAAGVPGPQVVASSGFADGDEPAARAEPTSRTGTVASAGFGAMEVETPPARRSTGTIAPVGFGTGVALEARKSKPRSRPIGDPETSVEIVAKPKPIYTEEARRRRIEGEVVLEVTFVASGRLQVLRVLSPLGFGLDEAAVEAAKKIQFTPARRNGIPVDYTATLRVVFRLA